MFLGRVLYVRAPFILKLPWYLVVFANGERSKLRLHVPPPFQGDHFSKMPNFSFQVKSYNRNLSWMTGGCFQPLVCYNLVYLSSYDAEYLFLWFFFQDMLPPPTGKSTSLKRSPSSLSTTSSRSSITVTDSPPMSPAVKDKGVNNLRSLCQHIDTLPKYGQKTPDVRRSTWRISNDGCKF